MEKCSQQLDSTLTDKEAAKDKSFSIKLEINAIKARKENLVGTKEYAAEKLAKAEAEVEESTQLIS